MTSLFLCHNVYAQNVIYKCTSSTGETTYQNNVGDKRECTKTNFGSFPNINIFSSDTPKNKTNNTNIKSFPNVSNNISEEQRIRDAKRLLILTQELSQEKEQLNTVTAMLKNLKDTNSKDTTQVSQLEELKSSHINNVTAIERELGNAKNSSKMEDLKIEKATFGSNFNNQSMMTTSVISANNSKNSLPMSLPEPIPLPPLTKEELANNKTIVSGEVKFNSIKPMIVKPIQTIKPTLIIDKNVSTEKRKTNSLGNTNHYGSGLSNMPKTKN